MPIGQENDKSCEIHKFARNNYFYGKLMMVRDFVDEQNYFNEKRHLINRLVHGSGVVCGLTIKEIKRDNDKIKITFKEGGLALDCCGHEIVVPDNKKESHLVNENGEPISANNIKWPKYLYLRYKPRCGEEKVRAASNPSSCDESCESTRIEEDYEVVASEIPNVNQEKCPDFPDLINSDTAREEIEIWIKKSLESCQTCKSEEPGVFLAKAENYEKINQDKTRNVYNNRLLSKLLNCHLSDFGNPHKALKTINGVGNFGERRVDNVILESEGTIDFKSEEDKDKIIINTIPAASVTSVENIQSVGISKKFAREDHVHDLADGVVTVDKIATDAVKRTHLNNDVINSLLMSSDSSITISSNSNNKNIDLKASLGGSSTGVVIFKNPGIEAISDEIDSGFRDGFISLILGLDRVKEFYIGSPELAYSFDFPPVLLGALIDPLSGKFKIRIRTIEKKAPDSIRVRWWAFKPGMDKGEVVVEKPTAKYIMYKLSEVKEIKIKNGLNEKGQKKTSGEYYCKLNENVALNGNPKKLVDLVLEQRDETSWYYESGGDIYEGETWLLGGWTLTVKNIDVMNEKAIFIIKYNGKLAEEIEIQKEKTYTYIEKKIEDESDIPMIVTYFEDLFYIGTIDKISLKYVRLKYTWVISKEFKSA